MTHALAALHAHSPGLVPYLRDTNETGFVPALLQGDLDVAFTTSPLEDPDLTRVQLGELASAVYAPAGLTVRKLAEHPFVLWGQRPDGTTRDGWPTATPRRTAAVVADHHAARALAHRIGALVVLPEAYAQPAVDRGELVVMRCKVLPMPVYAFHRHSLLPGGRAETLVQLAASAIAGGLQ